MTRGVAIECPTGHGKTRTERADEQPAQTVPTICGPVEVEARVFGWWLECGCFANSAGYELRSATKRGREVFWLESVAGAGT